MKMNYAESLSRVMINIHSCMEFNLDAKHHQLKIEECSGSEFYIDTPWFKEWELIRNGETAILTFRDGKALSVRILQVLNQNVQIRLCCENHTVIPLTQGVLHA